MTLLACPECAHSYLDLDEFTRDGEEILDGALTCGFCGRTFPVIGGVPRMLPDSLRGSLGIYHPEFFRLHPMPLGDASVNDDVARTLEFFTRQRVELYEGDVTPETWRRFEQTLNLRIPAARSFSGKLGLDAGCGEGRYIYTLSKYGAEIVGMDLGNAVDWAYRRAGSEPNVHVVQGSIFQPPFRDSAFQFVMSIGVIHHLTEPRRGFLSLVEKLAEDGEVHIWVYGIENMSLVYRASHLRPLRRVTSKLSPRQTHGLAVPIALSLEASLFLPIKLLAAIPKLHDRLDPQLLEVARLSLPHKVAEVHDRIGAPVTHFPTREEIGGWFKTGGLVDASVESTADGRGWSARGRRAKEPG